MTLRLLFRGNMYKIHCLKNGIRLVYEKMPHVKTVSVGVFIKSGSMYETEKEKGISADVLFDAIEVALITAFKKNFYSNGISINNYLSKCTNNSN